MTPQKTPHQLVQAQLKKAKAVAKKPQTLGSEEEQLKARIAASKAAKAAGLETFAEATKVETAQTTNYSRKNYAVEESEVIIITERVLENKTLLNVKKAKALAKELRINPNTTRMISEVAATIAFPETCKSNLTIAKEGRYFDIITAYLK